MNGLSAHQHPVGVPLTTYGNPGGAPRISPALLRGAKELTTIFEKRTAKLKDEYEEKIRVLIKERDAALVEASEGRSQGSDIGHAAQLAALRAEHDSERVQWEKERSQWQEERGRWEQERARGSEQLMKWATETNAIAKEREARQALERQVEVLRKEKEDLKEAMNSVLGAAAQVQDAEVQPLAGGSLGEMRANQSHGLALEATPPLSPARSMTLRTMASSGTLSTLKSPSQEPVPMQGLPPSHPDGSS
ncbi:hypothetical protein K466DRAFT_34347 [Polyporus arcularius HHB13444]|uniref:Uncharacterized protein n=1 Tax=Polyporus arcularius HHB13444 TaxID=1314778 RepID=A0A5C3PJ37_9APHY|nr:hypothetical protein K466DRAFT_34347 [Polyporus arcularius HHB13444]